MMGNKIYNHCDFCGCVYYAQSLGDHHDKRYCYECNTNPDRLSLIKISEQIGMPHHVVVEIQELQKKAALVDPMLEALEKIVNKDFATYTERVSVYAKARDLIAQAQEASDE